MKNNEESIDNKDFLEKNPIQKGYSSANAERSARMKAAIISLLNNEVQPLSKKEIQNKLDVFIGELNYKQSNFESILYQLVKNNLIKNLGKNPNGPGSIYASARHEFPQGNTLQKNPKEKKDFSMGKGVNSQLQLDGSQPTKVDGKVAPVTVDIIKSTGRIRLSINGMYIEIGVID